jgi:DNA repair exonuclease SbcCD nuclease subunit
MFVITKAVKEEPALDYFIIAGDLFDRIKLIYETDTHEAVGFFYWLMGICKTHKIKLRLMEGTPSHDRGQSSIFSIIHKYSESELVDYVYIPALTFREEKDGSTWVYVPDELHHDCSVVLDMVKKIIRSRGLEKVDFIVSHGLYDTHVGKAPITNYHLHKEYIALVNILIINGHIHTSSIVDDIMLTNGSFDRLCHGEEEPKGLWVIKAEKDKNFFTFYENKEASTFTTYNVKELNYEEAVNFISTKVKELKKGSVRIELSPEHNEKGLVKTLEDIFPHITWSGKNEKITKTDNSIFKTQKDKGIVITRNNLPTLVEERLTLSPALNKRCMDLLNNITSDL